MQKSSPFREFLIKLIGFSAAILMAYAGYTVNAHADTKYVSEVTSIYLDASGKQITPVEAYRTDGKIYECVAKEVRFNKRTGKPTLKKVD